MESIFNYKIYAIRLIWFHNFISNSLKSVFTNVAFENIWNSRKWNILREFDYLEHTRKIVSYQTYLNI
jgi:hypothetical protein